MELTTFGAYDAYWVARGWAQQAPIKSESRIDVPHGTVSVGQRDIAGVAWAQHVGIAAVDVQIDGGAWLPAELAPQDTTDTWRQWRLLWDAPAGDHRIAVRATDLTARCRRPIWRNLPRRRDGLPHGVGDRALSSG
jgi:hypothetical protein